MATWTSDGVVDKRILQTEEKPKDDDKADVESPVLSHLNDADGLSPLLTAANNADLDKTSQKQDFQVHDSTQFSSGGTSKAHRRGPEYCRMARYCKSVSQYKKERQRRKAAYELAVQGFNYEQIAEKLGVATKTVQRDFKKLRPYLERKHRHAINQFSEEMHKQLEASMAGMTDLQRFKHVTDLLLKLNKERHYNRHNFKLLINLDDLIGGVFPKITFIPKPPFTLTRKPGECTYMHFGYVKDGKEDLVGHLQTR